MNVVVERLENEKELLSKLGWKWAVMVSHIGMLHSSGDEISKNMVDQIRDSRVKLESGCYSPCEINCQLQEIESQIMTKLMVGPDTYDTDFFLYLISKAMSGTIKEEDLTLQAVRPVLSDCANLPCVCR